MKCVWILFSILFGLLTFVDSTSARKSEAMLDPSVEDDYSYSSTYRPLRASPRTYVSKGKSKLEPIKKNVRYEYYDYKHPPPGLHIHPYGNIISRSKFLEHKFRGHGRAEIPDQEPDEYSDEDESSIEEPPTERRFYHPHTRRRINRIIRRRRRRLVLINDRHFFRNKPANVMIYPRKNILIGRKCRYPYLGICNRLTVVGAYFTNELFVIGLMPMVSAQ